MAEDDPIAEIRVVGDFSEFDREAARRESRQYRAQIAGTFAGEQFGSVTTAPGYSVRSVNPGWAEPLPWPVESVRQGPAGLLPGIPAYRALPAPGRDTAASGGGGSLESASMRAAAALEHLTSALEAAAGATTRSGVQQLDPGQAGVVYQRLLPGPADPGTGYQFDPFARQRAALNAVYNLGSQFRGAIPMGGPTYEQGPQWYNMFRPPPQLGWQGRVNTADIPGRALPAPPGIGPEWAQTTLTPEYGPENRPIYGPQNQPILGPGNTNAPFRWGIQGRNWLNRQLNREVMNGRNFYNLVFGAMEVAHMVNEVEAADTATQTALTTPQLLNQTARDLTGGTRGILTSVATLPLYFADQALGTSVSPVMVAKRLQIGAARYEALDRTQDNLIRQDITSRIFADQRSGNMDRMEEGSIRAQAEQDLIENRKAQRERRERLGATSVVTPNIIQFYTPGSGHFLGEDYVESDIRDPGLRAALGSELTTLQGDETKRLKRAELEISKRWRVGEFNRDRQRTQLAGAVARARASGRSEREALEADIEWQTHEVLAGVEDPRMVDPTRRAMEQIGKERRRVFDIETNTRALTFRDRAELARAATRGAGRDELERIRQVQGHKEEFEVMSRLYPELIGPMVAAYRAEDEELAQSQGRRQARRRETIASQALQGMRAMQRRGRSDDLLLENKPFGAEIEMINADEANSLELAGMIPLRGVREAVQGEISKAAERRRQVATRARDQQQFLQDVDFGMRRTVQAREFARDPVGAESAQIAGQGAERTIQFLQKGQYYNALQEADLTVGQLELNRRQYLESFKAVELNASQITTSNPRDTTNPAMVLQGIRTDIQQFRDFIGTLLD